MTEGNPCGTSIGFPVRVGEWCVPIGTAVSEVAGSGRNLPQPLPLLFASIGAVTVEAGLVPMQQVGHLMVVMNIGRGDAGAMDQATATIHADVQFHAEVPLVAFLGLVHLRVAGLVLVLDRGRGGDQGGIDDGAARQAQAVLLQQFAHLGEDRRAQMVGFEQTAEVQQRPGIGDAFVSQVEATEIPKQRCVDERFFARFVGQVELVGDAVHAQHPFQSNPTGISFGHRRTAIPRLGVMRLDQGAQITPRHQPFHLR